MEAFPNKLVVKNMGQKYKDSAKAAAEADRITNIAEQNLQQALVSLRNCLHKTMRMLEVDPDCICVKSSDQESEWERRRRKLYKAADSIQKKVLCYALNQIETSLVDTDGLHERPHCPEKVGDDDLLWCDRVCVHEKVNMDSALWCNTPQHILELVFARLSLQQIFQLRSLSKHWRASIIAPSFQNAFGTTTSHSFGIIAGTGRKRLLSLGPSERKWHTHYFEFLPYDCDDPVAGDGGLLCCRRPALSSRTNQVKQDLELYVCNPLTLAWRKLPLPLLVQDFDLLHLVTNRQTKQYTITIVNDLQQGKQFIWNTKALVEVYNSSTNTWTVKNGIFHQSPGINLIYYKKYVAGKFVGIRAYDKATGYTSIAFNATEDILFAEDMGFYPLTEYQGQIYWLQTEAATSGIWVLRGPNHQWEKICSLPKPPDFLKLYRFSLHASTDVFIISGDIGRGRNYYLVATDEEPEKCLWMLDRAQGKWIDVLDRFKGKWIYRMECDWGPGDAWHFDDSWHFMFELRLDGIP